MRLKLLSATLPVGLAIILAAPGLARSEARIESNVIYGMDSGLALLLDAHYPDTPNGYGVILIPGSGWTAPLSADAEPLKERASVRQILGSDALLEAGYTLFAINHRSGPRFHYPAPVEDAQRAVRFIRHHADRFRIDADRIGAVGHSSGAHLAAMTGVLDGNEGRDDPGPVNNKSAKVQAVVALSAPSDFLEFLGGGNMLLGMRLTGSRIASGAYAKEIALFEQASPATHVSADDAPFLLIHGDADKVVPYRQSEIFRDKLAEAGVNTRLTSVPGGNHAFSGANSPSLSGYFAEMVAWFDLHLQETGAK